MTDPVETLKLWLRDSALPFWATNGVDPAGGFFEQLYPNGKVIEMPRRARLVARQIYVFATAEKLGWAGPGLLLVKHGLEFLCRFLLRDDGMVVGSVLASGDVINPDFNLYDHAFVLFGLAAAAEIGERREEMTQRADAIYGAMQRSWRHPQGGFEDGQGRSLPLKSNPHMHLLEAALAWAKLTGADRWISLCDEIATLALDHFVAPDTGAVHEYFGSDWQICDRYPLDVVEPGHQFEWAWLLSDWQAFCSSPRNDRPVEQLMRVGEDRGISSQNMAVNELNSDLTIRDGRHRLWPQTERLRAVHACQLTVTVWQCTTNLLKFFNHPVSGMWWEHLDNDGYPVREPSRASSLYHIISAFEELGVSLE